MLAKALPETTTGRRLLRVANIYRLVALTLLAFVLIPFAIDQYRLALHPQLHADASEVVPIATLSVPAPVMQMSAAIPDVAMESASREFKLSEPAAAVEAPPPPPPKQLDRYAPDAMLQTGPGTPDWRYLTYRLGWSGPVDPAQTLRLTILSPFWMSVWRIAGVILSGWLLFALVRFAFGDATRWQFPRWGRAVPLVVLGFTALLGSPPPAFAQAPDPQILSDLKQRLSPPPRCAPSCAQVVVATVDIDRDRLTVEMSVHAQAEIALGVPHAGTAWVIERSVIDGRESDALARRDGALEMPVGPGVHRIVLSGRIVGADELTLEFPAQPRRIAVRSDGWDSSGTNEGRLLNNALQLTRRTGTGADGATLAPQRFAPFVRIHRRVFMNLDWTVSTEIERMAPSGGAFTLRLPLLPGEAVLTPGFEVRNGFVLVSMPAGARSTRWDSSLERVDRLQWNAAVGQPWVEQWDVIVSPTWHAQFVGTPAILPSQYLNGAW